MRKILSILLIFIVGGAVSLLAQTHPITGRVTDDEGLPAVGVFVVIEGTENGTMTDIDGLFSLNASGDGAISVSMIGYKTQTIPIEGKSHFEITIHKDAVLLEGSTVVGYGTGSKIGTSIGSVAKVSSEELANKPTPNVADALQGKVAGLMIYTESGEPSAQSSIRLHGAGSISASTEPLYILDGVPVSSSVFTSLNSNDIESVNMLKDASATSIYGSRAANGVIYIATKRGRKNEPVRIVVNLQGGIAQPATSNYEVMNSSELAAYQLETKNITQEQYDDIMASGVNMNWRDYYYKSAAPTYQADLTVSGGSQNTSYYVSGSFMDTEGTAPGSELKRYSFRTSLDINATKWMKIGANANISFDQRRSAQTTSNSVFNAAFMSLLSLPYESPYDEDGNEKHTINGYKNPNYMIKTHPSRGSNLRISGSAYLQITPVKNLNIKTQLGVDSYAYWSEAFGLASYEGSLNNGTVSRAHQNGGTITSTTTIDYNFEFDNTDHLLYLLAGQEGIREDGLTFSAGRSGQIDDALMMLSTGVGTPSVADSRSSSVFCSWFGRAEYAYARRYSFDASVRRDVSSRFGAKHRAGIFYSVGAMWNIKNESFLQDNQTVSGLSLKVSYGTQGNAGISDYAHRSHLATTSYEDLVALYNASRGNEDLGWETQRLLTVAVNLSLADRVNIEAAYYHRQTDDLLMDVPEPATSGYITSPKNVAGMLNQGIDLSLNADIVRTRDWYLGINATFNYNSNKVTKLFNGLDEYLIPNSGVCYRVGHNAFDLYMQKFAGVNPETGMPQWEVVDKETGEVSLTEDYNKATLQMLDKPWIAPFTGGFGLTAGWKGIRLSADFVWNADKYLINNALIFLENTSYAGVFNRSKRLARMWRKPGDKTDVPKYGYDTQYDSSIVENASFLRLKNLTLSYDFPEALIEKTGFLKGVRLYVTSRNLLTFTSYSGYDPEVDSNLSLGEYPNSREFVGGVQFSF